MTTFFFLKKQIVVGFSLDLPGTAHGQARQEISPLKGARAGA
jgi:hypothetical protein